MVTFELSEDVGDFSRLNSGPYNAKERDGLATKVAVSSIWPVVVNDFCFSNQSRIGHTILFLGLTIFASSMA